MSQTDLGARIGVGQTRMADIEANPGLVSVEQLMRISQALGADLVLRTREPVELRGEIHVGARMTATLSNEPAQATTPLGSQRDATELDHFADMIDRTTEKVADAMDKVGRIHHLELTASTPLDKVPPAAIQPLAEALDMSAATFKRLLHAVIARRNSYLDQGAAKGSW